MDSNIVERVRAVYREWARGNFRAGAGILAPDVAFVTFTAEGDDITLHGATAVAAWMRQFLGTWRGLRVEARDFRESGDRVLVLGHQYAKGRQSDVEVEMPTFAVWTLRDGVVTRLQHTRDRAVAFAAAGLSE